MCCSLILKKAHIECSVNKAANFFSRSGLKVTEKVRLKISEDIRTRPTEVTTSSSDAADEEQFFFTQSHNEKETEEQILQRIKQTRKKPTDLVAEEEPS